MSTKQDMKKIRYAVIGLGAIAENRIIKEGFAYDKSRFTPLPNAELAGVTDNDPRRKKTAVTLGTRWFRSSEEIFKSKDIDAVIIATNNASHASLAKVAIEAGKHCLVEKPMATTIKNALLLKRLAQKNKVSLAVDHIMQHNVFNIMARDLLAKGRIGTVNDICLHMEMLYGSTPTEISSWRCAQPENLGGPIGDIGSHCFYMAEFLLKSRITALSCVYYPKTLEINVENGAYIKFETQSGMAGSIRVAFSEPRGGLMASLSNLGYEVYGTEGILRTYAALFQLSGYKDEPAKVRLEVEDTNKLKEYAVSKIANIYQSVIHEHAQSIITGKFNDGLEGVHNLKLILAAHRSGTENGCKVWISK